MNDEVDKPLIIIMAYMYPHNVIIIKIKISKQLLELHFFCCMPIIFLYLLDVYVDKTYNLVYKT